MVLALYVPVLNYFKTSYMVIIFISKQGLYSWNKVFTLHPIIQQKYVLPYATASS